MRLTRARHGGRVLLRPEEALLAVADGGPLAVAEAVQRTLGALQVHCESLVESRLARWMLRETDRTAGEYRLMVTEGEWDIELGAAHVSKAISIHTPAQ